MDASGSSRDPTRGRRIKDLRRAIGFTSAAALAKRLGVHVRSVENWEAGKPIDGPNLGRLASTLETTSDYIWTGQDGESEGSDAAALARRIDAIEGRLARERDLFRFVQSNFERIGELERAGKRIESELSGLRELMEGMATSVKALRTTGVAPPQPEAAESRPQERRATGRRPRTDPPPTPGS